MLTNCEDCWTVPLHCNFSASHVKWTVVWVFINQLFGSYSNWRLYSIWISDLLNTAFCLLVQFCLYSLFLNCRTLTYPFRALLFNCNCSYPLPITTPSKNTSLLHKPVIISIAENLLTWFHAQIQVCLLSNCSPTFTLKLYPYISVVFCPGNFYSTA